MYLRGFFNATLPLIALEEHFLSPTIPYPGPTPEQRASLLSFGPDRLAAMDANNLAIQVISHVPTTRPTTQFCIDNNNVLHDVIRSNPSRFAGFALLPIQNQTASVAEFRRSVRELGFVGALIPNHDNGSFFDGEDYWPMFAVAEELDVPVYLHPAWPSADLAAHYQGHFSPLAALKMGTEAWSWHSETGLHVLRLFAAGLFDRHPRLKVIIGHMGEMLPFMLDRILTISEPWSLEAWGPRKRGLRQVWDENLWFTTSGMFSIEPLKCLLGMAKHSRILFSVDYPFSNNTQGKEFVDAIAKSGLLKNQELEGFAYKNAAHLLGLKI